MWCGGVLLVGGDRGAWAGKGDAEMGGQIFWDGLATGLFLPGGEEGLGGGWGLGGAWELGVGIRVGVWGLFSHWIQC